MDLENDARRLLDRYDVLRHPSDLDLLIFFARHPRALLSTEQLTAFLGYGFKEIAASLDLLIEAGFLTRTPNRRHAARMYVFAVNGPAGGWLPGLMRFASTREGRLALISAIRRKSSQPSGEATQSRERDETSVADPLPFPGGRASLDHARTTDPPRQPEARERRTTGGHGEEQ